MRFMGLWDFATDPVGTILNALRTLLYELSGLIYKLIIWLYDIFMKLCNSRVLDSEVLELMASRVGVILGLIMLFMTMFSVVQMILEPEKLSDKEKGVGNIVKKILIVIVMLGMSSSAFSLMYGVQKTIIRSNIIAKFLLPYEVNTDNFGGVLSAELFTAFYKFDESLEVDGLDSDEEKCKNSINTLKGEIITYGTFTTGNDCLAEKSGDKYIMDFNWLLLPIVGIGAVYFIFSYCLSVGMRTFQLAFLEIISPMAIVSYLSPKKDTMFQKWWKIYFSTYIDVFLRIAIINVSVFLIAVIFDTNMSGTFWESVDNPTGGWTRTLLTVFIVMSLLMFAKKAPDLLKELFPSGASKLGMGITPPKKLLDNMAGADLIKRGYGAARVGTGRAIGNVRNAIGKAMDSGYDRKLLNSLMAERDEAESLGDDVAVAALEARIADQQKKRHERNRWALRAATSGFGGLLSGGAAGLGTTNASQRRTTIKNGVAGTKARYKQIDSGYGFSAAFWDENSRTAMGNYLSDIPNKMFNRDSNIDILTEGSDLQVQQIQQALNKLQADNPTARQINFKNGKYYKAGTLQEVNPSDYSDVERQIADLSAELGKATSKNKALHQKKEEVKKDK